MSVFGVLFMILFYLVIASIIVGFLFFIIKTAVKEGVLDALEEWYHGKNNK